MSINHLHHILSTKILSLLCTGALLKAEGDSFKGFLNLQFAQKVSTICQTRDQEVFKLPMTRAKVSSFIKKQVNPNQLLARNLHLHYIVLEMTSITN